MAIEEAGDLPCPFAGQERADGIDEASPGPDQLGGDIEQARLRFNQAVETFSSEAPAPFRVAAPGAAARAGRVDEDEVGVTAPIIEVIELSRRIEQPRFDRRASAVRPWSE